MSQLYVHSDVITINVTYIAGRWWGLDLRDMAGNLVWLKRISPGQLVVENKLLADQTGVSIRHGRRLSASARLCAKYAAIRLVFARLLNYVNFADRSNYSASLDRLRQRRRVTGISKIPRLTNLWIRSNEKAKAPLDNHCFIQMANTISVSSRSLRPIQHRRKYSRSFVSLKFCYD